MELRPLNPTHHSRSELYTYHDDGRRWLVKRYLELNADERCERERSYLTHWREHEFAVPSVCDADHVLFLEPYLVMQFIEGGTTLADRIKARLSAGECFFDLIRLILRENAARHALAAERSDHMLIHPDPNPFNILMNQEGFYSIDFESVLKNREVDELISLEVEQFILRVLRLVGVEHLSGLSDVLADAYSQQGDILERVVRCHYKHPILRTLKRGFGRRKIGVTRADLAAVLRVRLV